MISGTRFNWIETAGGPLILLPRRALRDWSGIETPTNRVVEAHFRWRDPDSPACDYDRSCDIDDYLGTIRVGEDDALVLGDMAMPTAWRPLGRGSGLFIRWMSAIDEDHIADVLSSLPDAIWGEPVIEFTVADGPLLLFDSACPGSQIEEFLSLQLPAGQYLVQTAMVEPDPETSLVLHRLAPG